VPDDVWKQIIEEVDKNGDGQVVQFDVFLGIALGVQGHDVETCGLRSPIERNKDISYHLHKQKSWLCFGWAAHTSMSSLETNP
jgi:hypothetical protein